MAASKAWTREFAALLVREMGSERALALIEAAQAIDAPQNASLRATLENLREPVANATPSSLAIIGRERGLVEAFARKLHYRASSLGDYTKIEDTRRGATFRVVVGDDKAIAQPPRTLRVTIEVVPD